MNFEALSRKLELGFFISNPYQALLKASLGGVLLQLVLCGVAYGLLFLLAQRISQWSILRSGNPNHLGARAVRDVAPHLAFAAVVSLVLHVIHANQDANALLLSKELAAVIGMVGLVKFFMWVLRDVMRPNNLLNFLLLMMTWALYLIIALSSLGLYGALLDAVNGLKFSIGSLELKGSNVIGGSIFAVVAYTVAGQTARLIDIALERYGRKQSIPSNDLMVMSRAFRVLIFTVVSMSVLMSLGIDGTQLVAFAGALGIGLGFGLQEVAVNLVSGLYILFEGSLKLGDYVTVNGISGRVAGLNSRSTVIEDEDGVRNLIPNSMITKEVLKSHPLNSDSYRFTFPVTLHSVDDFLQAKTLILGELKKHSHILDDKPQEVFVKSVNEECTKLEVSCWLNNIDRNPRQLLSDLYFGIAMALKAQGIKFSCNDELDASDD
jgi:small-conductance mechanosensitive channel